MQVKLADFGVCRLYENAQEHMAMTIVGTPIYMPQNLLSLEHTPHPSTFGPWVHHVRIGCAKYLITGPTDRDRLERARKVSSSQLSIPGYSTEFVRIISAMIKYHPDDRPSASDIIKSPEVQSITKKWAEEGDMVTSGLWTAHPLLPTRSPSTFWLARLFKIRRCC